MPNNEHDAAEPQERTMDKPFAIVDGQLYINEALISDNAVGIVRIGVIAFKRSLSPFQA